jgi:hypothetical protein
MRKMVRAGAGIFDKQEPEPHQNGPALQHCCLDFGPNRNLSQNMCKTLLTLVWIVKEFCFKN